MFISTLIASTFTLFSVNASTGNLTKVNLYSDTEEYTNMRYYYFSFDDTMDVNYRLYINDDNGNATTPFLYIHSWRYNNEEVQHVQITPKYQTNIYFYTFFDNVSSSYTDYDYVNTLTNPYDTSASMETDVDTSYYLRLTGFLFSQDLYESFTGEGNSYTTGYTDGFNEGQQTGYDDGYTTGHADGYTTGYNQGKHDYENADSQINAIFDGILSIGLIPIEFFMSIFNFEILGIKPIDKIPSKMALI